MSKYLLTGGARVARQAKKRVPIEEAAIYCFATRGLAGTTIREIAERAGVTEGALYRHYSSKEEMARRLFTREVEQFSREFEKVLFEGGATLAERIRRAVRFVYGYYAQHPVHFSFILLAQHGFPGQELLREVFNPNAMAIRFVTGQMQAGSVPAGDAVLTAAMLMGTVLQPLVMHRYGRLEREPLEVADEVAAACVRMLERRDG